jgi:hypothetical protein
VNARRRFGKPSHKPKIILGAAISRPSVGEENTKNKKGIKTNTARASHPGRIARGFSALLFRR